MRWRYSLSVIMIPRWLAASRHSAMQSCSRPSSNEYASSSGAYVLLFVVVCSSTPGSRSRSVVRGVRRRQTRRRGKGSVRTLIALGALDISLPHQPKKMHATRYVEPKGLPFCLQVPYSRTTKRRRQRQTGDLTQHRRTQRRVKLANGSRTTTSSTSQHRRLQAHRT